MLRRGLCSHATPIEETVKVIASSLRKGNVVEMDGKLYVILSAENIHPGKGTPVTQLDMRRISDGVKVSERYRTTEQVERAFVEDRKHQFLYHDGDGFHFMNPESYDQVAAAGRHRRRAGGLPAAGDGSDAQPARRRADRDRAAAARRPRSGRDRAGGEGPDRRPPPTSPPCSPTACAPWCRRTSPPAPRSSWLPRTAPTSSGRRSNAPARAYGAPRNDASEKRQRADFDALARTRIGRRGRVIEGGVRRPAGAAVLERIEDLEHDRLLAPHAREPEPLCFGL